MTLVRDFLENAAARSPAKTALVCEGKRWTYAQLDSMANRLANALTKGGVSRGDRVAIYLPNSTEAVVGIFAALKAGGVFVVINRSTKVEKLSYILNNCGAAAMIVDERTLAQGLAQQLLFEADTLRMVVACGEGEMGGAGASALRSLPAILRESSDARPPRRNIDLDLACLIYTSGTTGDPKGVMSDHSNVVFASDSIISYLENREDDIVINVLPLAFDYGLYQLLMTFRFGGTLVLENSFAFPAVILDLIQRERVTGLPGVPTIFAALLQADLSDYDLKSLRYLSNTAAALPPSHISELRRAFPGAAVYSMYGLTETKRTLYLPPADLDRKPGSVGIAIPGTEVWLEDESGNRLGGGVVGELVARGRHVMRGYWGDPEATARRYRPGRIPGERLCYTGDLFRMDEDGYMYFVSRQDDIIKSRGEKVAPKEVENVLYALPGVVEAAVIGVPDPILGQAIKAFVVSRDPGLTPAAVIAHCRAHLEDLMVPRDVEFRGPMPKTESGKIKKDGLR